MPYSIARILGARPQFMQAPTVRDALCRRGFQHVMAHTGQHYDASLSDVFFHDLNLPAPDVNLGVHASTHGAATGQMLEKIEGYLIATRPDAVLVDGDTNSTLAGALAAAKLHIPVFHIEGGIRDRDRSRPEEVNRIATDHLSDLNFAPVPRAFANLKAEGLVQHAELTGDVLLDCFIRFKPRANTGVADALGLEPDRYHVLTLHRPENTDIAELERFRAIVAALAALDLPVIWPQHPRTRPVVEAFDNTARRGAWGNIRRIEPLGYLDMLGLIAGSNTIFTDSGGLCREAAWSEKRVVMLFRFEAWHDLLENGWAQIGPTDEQSITDAITRAIPAPPSVRAFFGGGQASERIAAAIERFFTMRQTQVRV